MSWLKLSDGMKKMNGDSWLQTRKYAGEQKHVFNIRFHRVYGKHGFEDSYRLSHLWFFPMLKHKIAHKFTDVQCSSPQNVEISTYFIACDSSPFSGHTTKTVGQWVLKSGYSEPLIFQSTVTTYYYPLVIKLGNGKSHINGGLNRKSLILWCIFHCHV